MKEYFGEDKVLQVATFSKISSKTALEKACRGLGISNDISGYLKSLVPVNRGKNATLAECYFGDKNKGIKPISALNVEVEKYPNLKAISLKLEGVLANRGIHAAGLCICNEPYTTYTSAMRSQDGALTTSMDLWDSESVSLVKMDLLTVSAVQKIHRAMLEIVKYKGMEWQGNLKDTYNKYLHPDVLDYTTKEMWNEAPNIYGLFQWDTPISTKTLALIKPQSIMDLSAGNSLLRLMPEGAKESPVEKYIRYKENPQEWEVEASNYGLIEEEKQVIREICEDAYYMAESQEKIMRLSMHPKVAGYTLKEANKLRKSIAKKDAKLQEEAKAQFYEWGHKQGTRQIFLDYVWNELFSASMGYSFSSIHSYAYSVIALQELNIYYHYGPIFWNLACLSTEAILDEEGSGNNTDYGKISKAIYKMKAHNIEVQPPSINSGETDFTCNPDKDLIYFALGAISGINNNIVEQINQNIPYKSFKDFYNKNTFKESLITKSKFIQLIKAGCFDEFNSNRIQVMKEYFSYIVPKKDSLTLANVSKLLQLGINVPKEIRQPYTFKSYVCSAKFFYGHHPNFKTKKLYWLDNVSLKFFNKHCRDLLQEEVDFWYENEKIIVVDKSLEKIFKKQFQKLSEYINTPEVLEQYNKAMVEFEYNSSIDNEDVNKWSFDTCSYFSKEHILKNMNYGKYPIDKYNELPEKPLFIEKSFKNRSWKQYVLSLICGVVIDKNDIKHIITLLTPEDNVVNIKMNGEMFAHYKSQISVTNEEGKKTVVDKPWIARGQMLIVSGYRNGADSFICKHYKNSILPHSLVKIDRIYKDGSVDIISERYKENIENNY